MKEVGLERSFCLHSRYALGSAAAWHCKEQRLGKAVIVLRCSLSTEALTLCLAFLPVHQGCTVPCSATKLCHSFSYPCLPFSGMCVYGGLCQEVEWLVPKAGFCPQQSSECRHSDVCTPTMGPGQPYPHFQSFNERSHSILPSQMALSSDIQLIQADIL